MTTKTITEETRAAYEAEVKDKQSLLLEAAKRRIRLTDEEKAKLLRLYEVAPELREILDYCWQLWAREDQVPPDGDAWHIWQLRSGRGAGKTRAGSEQVIDWAMAGYTPIALIGQTKADVRDTMIELGDSSIIKRSPPWFMPEYISSKRRLTWPNGVEAVIYSGDEPGQLRGPQHAKAWVDELAKFKYPEETIDNLEFGLRVGDNPQWISTTTPRPIKIIRELLKDPDCINMVASTFANAANLPEKFLNRLRLKYVGTALGRQELEGELLEDTAGALWKLGMIEMLRVTEEPPPFRRIVSWDPATTSKKTSDEHGIVVCSTGAPYYREGETSLLGSLDVFHGYVIEDLSDVYTPNQACDVVVEAYYRLGLDRVVAENNQGGDWIESLLRTKDPNVKYKGIPASESKKGRAEPVSGLYEQHRIHHVGMFPELEDELTTWTGPPDPSPNRLDAVVHGFAFLFNLAKKGKKKVRVMGSRR